MRTRIPCFRGKSVTLLAGHNGDLVYRIRPNKSAFVESGRELPYEIHLVTFGGKADFEGYKNDPKRLDFIGMKNNSVEKIILIEGFEL